MRAATRQFFPGACCPVGELFKTRNAEPTVLSARLISSLLLLLLLQGFLARLLIELSNLDCLEKYARADGRAERGGVTCSGALCTHICAHAHAPSRERPLADQQGAFAIARARARARTRPPAPALGSPMGGGSAPHLHTGQRRNVCVADCIRRVLRAHASLARARETATVRS